MWTAGAKGRKWHKKCAKWGSEKVHFKCTRTIIFVSMFGAGRCFYEATSVNCLKVFLN
jgi:hypothetical protein